MTTILDQQITLEEFLKLPETKPASEFIMVVSTKTHAPRQTLSATAQNSAMRLTK
jgi:hypothetical protein